MKKILLSLTMLLLICNANAQNITTIAGRGNSDGIAATAASIYNPIAAVIDAAGNIYIAESNNNRIRKVTAATGIITTVAGNGIGGYAGDAGPATDANLNTPNGVAVDAAGNIYIADYGNNRIRKVTVATGIISTIAGNGTQGYSGDAGAAEMASLNQPYGLTLDTVGNIYIADTFNSRIRKVAVATGIITTVAGNGTAAFLGDGGVATAASINSPRGVAVDAAGNIYIADANNSKIRKITVATGKISTLVDGTNSLNQPYGITLDTVGHIYIADRGNKIILKVTVATGISTIIAGTGASAFVGDGGAATAAQFNNPTGIALDTSGNIYIADSNNFRVRKITVSTGIISTVAGNGIICFAGDAGAATAANLSGPTGVAFDTAGNIYIADSNNNRIRKVTASAGIISTVAGNETKGYAGDAGVATAASLSNPYGMALDAAGNIYIADTDNNRIRKITVATGIITTVAGNGLQGFSGDAAAAATASLYGPRGVALDAAGNIYIADYYNNRIRKITVATGFISTVAGNGTAGYIGNGGAATSAQLTKPTGIAVDASGNIYIADSGNNRIRKITVATGIISTIAGNGTAGYTGDGGLATLAKLGYPTGVAVDSVGNIYFADYSNNTIRKVSATTSNISTVAGIGTAGYSGDAGAATAALLKSPQGVGLDSTGNFYIADTANNSIRKVTQVVTPIITTNATTTAAFNTVYGTASAVQTFTISSTNLFSTLTATAPVGFEVASNGVNFGATATFSAGFTSVQGTLSVRLKAAATVGNYNAKNIVLSATNTTSVNIVTPSTGNAVTAKPLSITATDQTKTYGTTLALGTTLFSTVGLANAETVGSVSLSSTGAISTAAAGAYAIVPSAATGGTFLASNYTISYINGVLTVNPAAPIISYGVGAQTYTVGTAITPLLPTNTGGAVPAIIFGQVNTAVGSGAQGAADGTSTTASFYRPTCVALDAAGNMYVADQYNNKIRKITSAGVVSTLAGSGALGAADGTGAAASFNYPFGLVVDASGNVYVADSGNNKIRKITPAGVVTTFAGTGVQGSTDGLPTAAKFFFPTCIVIDGSGNLYVTDYSNHKIRKITPTGTVSTFAGSGVAGAVDATGTAAGFNNPIGIAIDAAGNLFVADKSNQKIRKITPAGVVTTFAGTGALGSTNGLTTVATFNYPQGVALDALGNMYVADASNNTIRKITAAGMVNTLAGSGVAGADDLVGTSATFSLPISLTVDNSLNVYVADYFNNKIRKIAQPVGGYSINPALPTGLNFNSATGQISGAASVATSATTYTITGYNAGGSGSTTLSFATANLKISGSAVGATDIILTSTDGINFTKESITFSAGTAKFIVDGTTNQWSSTGFPQGTGQLNGSLIPVPAGTFNVSFRNDTKAYAFQSTVVSIIGDFNSWSTDVDMTTTDNVNYTLYNQVFATNTTLKFRDNHSWTINFGGTGMTGTGVFDGSNIAVPAGSYTITFNRSTLAYTIITTPLPPTAANQTFCTGATVANLVATGTALKWYAAATGGTALASTTVLAAGTYYVSQTVGGAESARTAVVVAINDPQITASASTVCAGTAVNLTASTALSGSGTAVLPTNLQSGLVGYWPFNGNANDLSGNGNNGTVTGATLMADRFGNPNAAYNFSGANQFITCPNLNVVNGLSSASFSLWVKITGDNAWLNNGSGSAQYLLSRDGDFSSTSIGINYGPGNNLFGARIGANYGNVVVVRSSNTYPRPQSNWHNIAYTIGNGFMNLYVDGVFNSSNPFTGAIASSSSNLFFGKLPVSGFEYYLNGNLDDVAIYNRALSLSEIQQLNNSSTYLWSTGETTATINPTPTATTTYWCDVTTYGVTCRKTITITITPKTTPTFTQVAAVCSGTTITALPTTSTNGITGTWSPAINNTVTTLYTFTPTAGLCANTATMTITINPKTTPTFTQAAPICFGATSLTPLPNTSNNGITGTWSPALNSSSPTTYTFTPTAGLCANTTTMTTSIVGTNTNVALNKPATASGFYGTTVPSLAFDGILTNGWVTGAYTGWIQVDLQGSFTINQLKLVVGQYPNGNTTHQIYAAPSVQGPWTLVETLSGYTSSGDVLVRDYAAAPLTNIGAIKLSTLSTPSWVSWAEIEVYALTSISATITTTAPLSFCAGGTAALNANTGVGFTYQWKKDGATIGGETSASYNATASGSYTVVVTDSNGCFATSEPKVVTVTPITTPTFTTAATVCSGTTITALPTTSTNGITGTWSPAINNTTTTTYTFTPTVGQCANTTTQTITITAPKVTSAISFVAPVAALPSVTIGTQIWTNRNLDVNTYRDGTPIPQVTDPTAWVNLTTGAWCYYNNDPANGAIYGKLYNWYAVAGIYDAASLANPALRKQIAPIGWHVPNDNEWTTLTNYLGGLIGAGGKMKETGTAHWLSPNTGATNSSGFTGLSGGYRGNDGPYYNMGSHVFWWCSSESSSANAYAYGLYYLNNDSGRGPGSKTTGFSVRLIKD